MMEDTAVIVAARAGDRAAFDAIVQRYQARIACYILRLVHDQELALDLTQDTFLEAFRGIHNLRSELTLGAWLYRIATNLVKRAHRRKHGLVWQSLSEFEEDRTVTVEAPDFLVMDRDQVLRALHSLPRDRAAALLLHVLEGFSYTEVAAIMGTSAEAVRKRIARAKEQFRANYDAVGGETLRHAVR